MDDIIKLMKSSKTANSDKVEQAAQKAMVALQKVQMEN
jgi:hypothetical protein